GEQAATQAALAFERRFSRRELPEGLEEKKVVRGTTIEQLLTQVGFAQSGSDAARKVQQGAVRIDGEKFTQLRARVDRVAPFVLQVGRHACRVVPVEPA